VVVEGYFDAMAMHQAGLRHTVATSGTALTADQARMLKRLVPRVALTYDGDRAGREAMMRSLGTLLAEGLDVAVVDLPDGEDPDTLLVRGGLAAWEDARRRAADAAEFVQRHVLRAAGGEAGDPRERAAQAVVRLAVGVADPIRMRLLIERASQLLGLSEGVLTRAVALQRGGADSRSPIGAAVRAVGHTERTLERRLLQALLLAPDELGDARQRLSPEDFRDLDCAALALALWSGQPRDGQTEALERELTAESQELDWAAEARGGVRRMVERRLLRQLQERRQQLHHAPPPEEAARLMQEIDELARSLRDLST
jgi:DNA primase